MSLHPPRSLLGLDVASALCGHDATSASWGLRVVSITWGLCVLASISWSRSSRRVASWTSIRGKGRRAPKKSVALIKILAFYWVRLLWLPLVGRCDFESQDAYMGFFIQQLQESESYVDTTSIVGMPTFIERLLHSTTSSGVWVLCRYDFKSQNDYVCGLLHSMTPRVRVLCWHDFESRNDYVTLGRLVHSTNSIVGVVRWLRDNSGYADFGWQGKREIVLSSKCHPPEMRGWACIYRF